MAQHDVLVSVSAMPLHASGQSSYRDKDRDIEVKLHGRIGCAIAGTSTRLDKLLQEYMDERDGTDVA